MAYDVESLRRNLLHSQYDVAQSIRQSCYENGMGFALTVAICYKAGYSDGRKATKGRLSKVFQERDELKERIDALAIEEEIELSEMEVDNND